MKDLPANKRKQLLHNYAVIAGGLWGNEGRQRVGDTNILAVMVTAASTLVEEKSYYIEQKKRRKCACVFIHLCRRKEKGWKRD